MIKRFAVMCVALLLVFGGVIGFKLYKQKAIRDYVAGMGPPVVVLNAVRAQEREWRPSLHAIGSLRARHGIEIRNEVDGVVDSIHVQSGQSIAAGELIIKLDDTVERAALKSAGVRLGQAQRNFDRDRKLYERKLLAEDDFDNSRSELDAARALVEETQGIIDRKTIRAPFAGKLGIHSLSEGHYLQQGDSVVSLQNLEKLYLDFNLPENNLAKLAVGQLVEFTVPAFGEQVFQGVIESINVRIQESTRNILVRALVENATLSLLPGMFADIRIVLDEHRKSIFVPHQSVAYSLYGETVYLLEAASGANQPDSDKMHFKSSSRRVTTGQVLGELVEVFGLEAGDLIARDSQNKLSGATMLVDISNLHEIQSDHAGEE